VARDHVREETNRQRSRLDEEAEDLDHHPDLDIRWRTVRALCSTHDVGGLTELDFALAGAIDDAFGTESA
jgi:4a-hydroxytetrahydrobiopterin dehydratase